MGFEKKKETGQRLFFYYRKSIAIIIFLSFWELAPRVELAYRMVCNRGGMGDWR